MRTDRDRLLDILESIRRVIGKLPGTREEFVRSDLLQIWVIYHIQVIGEAANGLSTEFLESPRDHPVAGYHWNEAHPCPPLVFGIDISEVWNTATIDLPEMERKIQTILDCEV